MSKFAVEVVRIRAIEPITGADAIELAVVGGYRSVVKKGDYKVGDLAVYIPEQAIVPDWLLERMNLTGRLAGTNKNRVKAIKLRGCLSQGLLIPVKHVAASGANYIQNDVSLIPVKEGDDVADFLGIVKHEVPIPAHLAGEVYNAGSHLTVPYDIENYKKFVDVFEDGEEVVFTEKLHGTFTGIGILPRGDWEEKHFLSRFVIFSKGLGARGLCFKDCDNNADNLYVRTLMESDIFSRLSDLMEEMEEEHGFDRPLFLLGETFGAGVQDLQYGNLPASFRLFDVCVGYRGDQFFFDYEGRVRLANHLEIPMVPILYKGPFSQAVLDQYTNGKETVSGKESHIREGVVITPVVEREHPELGRVILKSVSADYLLRKNENATEYN